jgi:predicted metal-binding protein
VTSPSTLYVCITCRSETTAPDAPRPGARLFAAVEQRLAGDGMGLNIVAVECLSNCQRSCSAAVSAPGKWTYVIGGLDPDRHVGDILEFARLHQAHDQGLPVWRERPDHVRKNTVARVPPMNPKEQQ